MSTTDPAISGLLLVDKPGLAVVPNLPWPDDEVAVSSVRPNPPTSHDVVQRVRRFSGQKRIGHTGTLDPMASGLLVMCLGWATRLVEYYQGHDKEYLAEVTLGVATDTYDRLGQETERRPVPDLSTETIERALGDFRGAILQRPPAFSALKQGGESVHRKARRGEEVVLEPRLITFHAIELLDFARPNRMQLRLRCSAGGYVRSLAFDLGRALGTVGTLTVLRRVAAGPFQIADAHRLDAIEAAANAAALGSLILLPGAGLDLPELHPDEDALRRFGHGQVVSLPVLNAIAATEQSPSATIGQAPAPAPDGIQASQSILAQAIDTRGRLAGIVRCIQPAPPGEEIALWQAEKWFGAENYADL